GGGGEICPPCGAGAPPESSAARAAAMVPPFWCGQRRWRIASSWRHTSSTSGLPINSTQPTHHAISPRPQAQSATARRSSWTSTPAVSRDALEGTVHCGRSVARARSSSADVAASPPSSHSSANFKLRNACSLVGCGVASTNSLASSPRRVHGEYSADNQKPAVPENGADASQEPRETAASRCPSP